jgi:MFS family permease
LPRGRHVAGETTDDYRWWVLAVTSIGALLASLSSGTLIIALPDILRDLRTDLFALLWIVVGYTLVVTVLVLNAGRIADLTGRARAFTVGFALFTVASILSALAPSAITLIAARVVQGAGGALLMATSAALVTDAFPRRELGRALGINGMVIGARFSGSTSRSVSSGRLRPRPSSSSRQRTADGSASTGSGPPCT